MLLLNPIENDFAICSVWSWKIRSSVCSWQGRKVHVHVPNFGRVSGSEDRGKGDNSIQFINIGREGDKNFKEWRRKIGGWKGG